MKKKSSYLIIVIIIMLCMISCKDKKTSKESSKNASGDAIKNIQSIEKAIEEEQVQEKKDSEEYNKEEIEKQNPPEVSKTWSDLEFGFENSKYKIPFAVNVLEDNGWKINLLESGYNERTELDVNQKIAGTVKLTNEKYDEKLQVSVGFINETNKKLNILESNIWSFECSIVYGFEKIERYPVMVIGEGITWGASKEEVEKKLGNPDITYESKEHKYVKYTYKKESISLETTIYDKEGLVCIALRRF